MKIESFDKTFHKIIKEVAQIYDIGFELVADNRVVELTKDGKLRRIVGYNLDLNDSGSWMAAKYKDITSSIFENRNIPHIEHKVFRNPKIFSHIEPNWVEMIKFAEKYDYAIVCKPNSGSLGTGVTHIKNQAHLEEITTNLFSQHPAITLSPYYNLVSETRFVILDSTCVLIFKKERPSLHGNGKDTVSKLLQEFTSSFETLEEFAEFFKQKELPQNNFTPLNQILPEGTTVNLYWKHNDSKASYYSIVAKSPFEDLAISAANALNLRFSGIDIVETSIGPRVLEANTGADFIRLYNNHYETVKEVYSKVLRRMFEIE